MGAEEKELMNVGAEAMGVMEWDRKQVWSSAYGASMAQLMIEESRIVQVGDLEPGEGARRYNRIVDASTGIADEAVRALESRDRVAEITAQYVSYVGGMERAKLTKGKHRVSTVDGGFCLLCGVCCQDGDCGTCPQPKEGGE
jgi:hypothetical protein